MSLLHWYKLDGDATDSIGNNNLTTNTATYTSTGKIGGAYTFAANNTINNTSGLTLYYDATISAWGYATSFTTTSPMLFSLNSNAFSGADLYFTNNTINWNTGDGSGNPFKNNGVVVTQPSLNTWHHYTVVISSSLNKAILYLDGAYYGEALYRSPYQVNKGFTIGNYYPGSTGYAWIGMIDDVRIYNHALSPKEVKELSQAKVLHYNFDDFQEPTTNLAPNTDYSNRTYNYPYTANSWDVDAATVTYYSSGGFNNLPYKKMVKTAGGAGGSYLNDNIGIIIEDNKTYTISVYMKADRSGITGLDQYSTCINRVSDNTYRTGGSVPVLTNEWQKFTWVYVSGVGHAGTYQTKHIIYVDNGLPIEIYWCGFQVEVKDHATPFVNGSRTGTVHDVSGYGNDAPLVLATTPQWYEDGIGKGCYRFNGTTSGIERIGDFSDIKTISMWVNSQTVPTDSRVLLVHQPTGVGLGFYNNGYLILTSTGNSQRTAIISNFKNNDWNHIAVTYSDAKVPTCYINGAETTYSTTDYWTVPETTLYIGRRTSGSAFNGQIDDVRIYATALSADDVKELYQTRANLDNVGNLFTKCIALPEDVTTGLTNYWNFDSNAVDSVSGNNGTVTGATLTSGIINGAYSFNGTSNYITLASTINLNSNANWTVILWAKTIDDNGTFLSNSSGGPVYSRFGIAGGKIEYYHYNGGWLTKTGNITVNTDNWVMLTWINRSNATMDMYVNGVLDYGNFSSTLSSAGAVNQFGKDWSSNYFAGLMDDVRIYNRCLTPSEIKLLYSKGFR